MRRGMGAEVVKAVLSKLKAVSISGTVRSEVKVEGFWAVIANCNMRKEKDAMGKKCECRSSTSIGLGIKR